MENTRQGRTPFGERLLKARKQRGLTQKQVEMHVGIAQSNLAELELKGTGSSFTVSLALLYGVNPVWLALGKGPVTGGAPAPEWLKGMTDEELASIEQFARELVASRGSEATDSDPAPVPVKAKGKTGRQTVAKDRK